MQLDDFIFLEIHIYYNFFNQMEVLWKPKQDNFFYNLLQVGERSHLEYG